VLVFRSPVSSPGRVPAVVLDGGCCERCCRRRPQAKPMTSVLRVIPWLQTPFLGIPRPARGWLPGLIADGSAWLDRPRRCCCGHSTFVPCCSDQSSARRQADFSSPSGACARLPIPLGNPREALSQATSFLQMAGSQGRYLKWNPRRTTLRSIAILSARPAFKAGHAFWRRSPALSTIRFSKG